MARAARASGSCVIVATVVPPAHPDLIRRVVWRNSIVGDVAALNRSIGEKLGGDIVLLNAAAMLPLAADGHLAPESSLDTLHFNLGAYQRLNDAVGEALRSCPPDGADDRLR